MKNEYAEKYIGTTKTMHCGLKATIIAYRNSKDIDVQFENGTIRKHTAVNNFKRCELSPTKARTQDENIKKYTGMTRTMTCGMKATIIKYRKATNIDVQFENEIIREHTNIYDFERGHISYAKQKLPTTNENKQKYLGMTHKMKCGMKATIIAYHTSKDIDIQFENGEIHKHKGLYAFQNGQIAPENYQQLSINKRYLGKTKMMSCGLKATIIVCRNSQDIDVQFEDGTIREHIRTDYFNTTHIAHPTNVLFNTYKLNKIAFVFHDTAYFDVSYIDNNIECRDIMSVQDMKEKLTELA